MTVVLYASLAFFCIGLLYRILLYWRTPQPFNITTMPAPRTRLGVLVRLAKETFLFQSLFRASRWTWVFAWLMHVALVLLFAKHFFYVMDTTPVWLAWLLAAGHWLFAAFLLGLLGLLIRRIAVARIRYISAPSDYLMLVLLIAIAVSGFSMHLGDPINMAAVKQATQRFLGWEFTGFPNDIRLKVHLSLVALLLLVFPFSKLLHAPGLFFSPTRNQPDNARDNHGS